MKTLIFSITSGILMLTLAVPSTSQSFAQEKTIQTKSLYDRLGGVYAIATVVDDFIERLLVNEILNANPNIFEARERVPKAGLKFQVTAQVCQATGGPQQYVGRNMKEAHKHLNINEEEWNALVTDFRKTLLKFKVPEKEQQELFEIIGKTHDDIVTRK